MYICNIEKLIGFKRTAMGHNQFLVSYTRGSHDMVKIDMGKYSPYSLRYPWTACAFRAGLTSSEIAEISGHLSQKILEGYWRWAKDQATKNRNIEVLQKFVFEEEESWLANKCAADRRVIKRNNELLSGVEQRNNMRVMTLDVDIPNIPISQMMTSNAANNSQLQMLCLFLLYFVIFYK